MSVTYRIHSSPFNEDYRDEYSAPPWDYSPNTLVMWVDEVFLEGYKKDEPLPTVGEALDVLKERGYEVEVLDGYK